MSSKKHFFNMVEVALALLVISLGLSTVLTLFPAGLKATREAENANNLVEAAEHVFAYLQKQDIDTLTEVNTRYDAIPNLNDRDVGKRITSPQPGVYVFRKWSRISSGEVEDFSCVAQILAPEKNSGPGTGTNTGNDVVTYLPDADTAGSSFPESGLKPRTKVYTYQFSEENSGNIQVNLSNGSILLGKIIDVEFSYPASTEYDKRTKRVYRMCVLNNQCDFYN